MFATLTDVSEFYTLSVNDSLKKLKADPKLGLPKGVRSKLLEKYGYNKLPEPPKSSLLVDLIEQLKNPLVILLLAAAVLSGATGSNFEAILIFAIVFLMAGIGIFLERQSEKSLDKLKDLQTDYATILKNGKNEKIKSELLVPGDILVLTEGDKVPADARVIETNEVMLDESALTGEALPISKNIKPLAKNTALGDRTNMIFSGTAVVSGSVKAVVVATGQTTEMGKIAEYLKEGEVRLTPLQVELEKVGKFLLVGCIVVSAVIFVIYVAQGVSVTESLLTTASLAIAFVPEGLSAVLTVTLALAVREMVAKKVIVKKLLAAEGLGSITHIATDKTGTITEGRMHVDKVYLGGKLYAAKSGDLKKKKHFDRLIDIVRFCNNNKGPTEQALVAFLETHGYNYELEGRHAEYQFTSSFKRMTISRAHSGGVGFFSKGAPDILIPMCAKNISTGGVFSAKDKEKTLKEAEKLASQGFRVLALADKIHKGKLVGKNRERAESDLVFVGLVALIDPLRDTVKETVAAMKTAGITPLMITGDHPAIARYIAIEAGILGKGKSELVITGNELDVMFARMDLPEVKKKLMNARVFARVRPEHKVMIVEMFQAEGFRIAMTGDGINDAAAIKRADVGIAMSNGMDITRDISDVVITGAYDALIRAVVIGRIVKLRTKLYLHYILSGNACQVGVFVAAVLLGLPSPLTPVMLLIINLLTDALPAMAMGVEPEDTDIVKQKVKKEGESIVSKEVVRGILVQGLVSTILLTGIFYLFLPMGLVYAQTIAFTFFIFQKVLRGITARSFTKSALSYGIFTNRLMNISLPLVVVVWFVCVFVFPGVFEMESIILTDLVLALLLASILPIVEETTKLKRFAFN